MNYIIVNLKNKIFEKLVTDKLQLQLHEKQVFVINNQVIDINKEDAIIYISDEKDIKDKKTININDFVEWTDFMKVLSGYLKQDYIENYLYDTGSKKNFEKDIKHLTKRENEILNLIAKGLLNKEIAEELHITERTVKNHISNIFKKINVYDRTQAAVYAIEQGIYLL